jgi:hypothetical protein
MTRNITILLLILYSSLGFSQEINLSEVIVNIAEELADDESDPEGVASYIERLQELADDPVKINTTNEDETSRIFFLSDFQVRALADYVKTSGNIISIYELANIPGFDKKTAELLMPFIAINDKTNINSYAARWRSTLLTNFLIKPGTADSTLLGSPLKVLTKYKFISGNFSGGLTSEKDAGERLFNLNSPQTDFMSAHLAYKGKGILKKFIIGDYAARFGQGTTTNTGIRTALSLTAPGYMSARDEIKPYTSTNENNFFRGVATEFSFNKFGLNLFYSKNYLDATLGSSSGSSEDLIKNFYNTGIHNTHSLAQKKDAVSEIAMGMNLSYNFKKLKFGMVWSDNKFSLPVQPETNTKNNIFAFRGDRNTLYSIYYSSLFRRILLYGELSMNELNRHAFVQGLSIRPSDRLIVNFLFRNYDAAYISFHGRGPGNNSITGNENGILGSFSFEAARHFFISAGFDIYNFPWLKYRCTSPSQGTKREVRAKYIPSEKFAVEATYSYKATMVDVIEPVGIPKLNKYITERIKCSLRYSLHEDLTLGTRIDYKVVDPSNSQGILLLQDMIYKFKPFPLTLWFRYCIFNTDNWDSRLYTYENDLLYNFSIPALSGIGSRSYIMVKYDIADFAVIRVKYGITSLIQEGYSNNNTNEIKVQFKIRF